MCTVEDFPKLRGSVRFGGLRDDSMVQLYDVKFYPYNAPRHDPVFAVVGSRTTIICRPSCDRKNLIQILQIFYDDENCVYHSLTWTRLELNGTLEPLVIVAGKPPKIKVISALKGELISTLIGHGQLINDLAISPVKPHVLASASADSSIRLWDLRPEFSTSPCIAALSGEGHEKDVLSIDFHSSGRYLLSAGMDWRINLWIISDLPDKFTKRRCLRITNPHFSSRDVHSNIVDCVKFYGNLVFSRSANECRIALWSIVGFDDYIKAFSSHTHTCCIETGNSGFKSKPTEQYIRDCECTKCVICNVLPVPSLDMAHGTRSAFNISGGRRPRSTVGQDGETSFQILMLFDLPQSDTYYARFSIFEPAYSSETTENKRTKEEHDALVKQENNSLNVKDQSETSETRIYTHPMLCAGNERSRFYFWDLDCMDRCTVSMGSLFVPLKRQRVDALPIDRIMTTSITSRTCEDVKHEPTNEIGGKNNVDAVQHTKDNENNIDEEQDKVGRKFLLYAKKASNNNTNTDKTANEQKQGGSNSSSAERENVWRGSERIRRSMSMTPPINVTVKTLMTASTKGGISSSSVSSDTISPINQDTQGTHSESLMGDPTRVITAHRAETVPRIAFVVRQIAWSTGGEWCIGVGDCGVIAVFKRE